MRFLFSLLTLAGILVFGWAPSSATPIKVDLKKLIDRAENERPYQYMPTGGLEWPEKPDLRPPPLARMQDAEARQWLVRLATRIQNADGFAVAILDCASSAAAVTISLVPLQHRYLTTLHCADEAPRLLTILNRRRGAFFNLQSWIACCFEPDYYLFRTLPVSRPLRTLCVG